MELQWPLILFTAFVAWSAGLFGTQSLLAIKGEGKQAQTPALIASVVLLAVGGIAVFFHLEHWERIFNGFGQIYSGITQELIAIVVMIVIMVAYFVCLRKGEGTVPKGLAIIGVVISVVLVIVAGLSYLMPARPAWNSPVEILSLLGNALVLGPATFLLIASVRNAEEDGLAAKLFGPGALVNAITTILFLVVMAMAGAALTNVGHYFDPVHPTHAVATAANANPFAGDALTPSILAIVAAVAAWIVAQFGGKAIKDRKVVAAIVLVLGLVGAICLRMTFYAVGISVFMFY